MKIILAAFLALVTLLWGIDLLSPAHTSSATLPWRIYQEGLFLTGLWSIALMSLAMMLALRPIWLERPLGGMDRVYQLHKWSGILAVVMAGLHWLIEMSDDVLKALAGRAERGKHDFEGFTEALRDSGEALGEWGIYLLLGMLALTLWKRFPYRAWGWLHRVMPVLYAMLAFHAVVLAPPDYWGQAIGALMALLISGGMIAGALSLSGRIGRGRQVTGRIVSVSSPAPDVTEVTCSLDAAWRGHRAGQFAFVRFHDGEGAHPFTIASADRGDHTVTFIIKALGDYTHGLAQRLTPGQGVRIEGPYGRFIAARHNRHARQVWVAGGIGLTPFLAWLEAMRNNPTEAVAADLHYCTRDRANDPFISRLESLCAELPQVTLHIHGAAQGERLTAKDLGDAGNGRIEVWFCGPRGLAASLQQGFRHHERKVRLHREAFEMR
ncbi:MAG: ferric reductase-like transmembrane domain-containing protein [Gammaproteobacteria bacterium]|nr:ferric reductase-like transmembrane domain-containing protein [Gammaproteobacteria bacterium]